MKLLNAVLFFALTPVMVQAQVNAVSTAAVKVGNSSRSLRAVCFALVAGEGIAVSKFVFWPSLANYEDC